MITVHIEVSGGVAYPIKATTTKPAEVNTKVEVAIKDFDEGDANDYIILVAELNGIIISADTINGVYEDDSAVPDTTPNDFYDSLSTLKPGVTITTKVTPEQYQTIDDEFHIYKASAFNKSLPAGR